METLCNATHHSRKNKSLAIKCQKILKYICEDSDADMLSIKTISTAFSIDRRSVIDIFNIFKGLGILSQQPRGTFGWIGTNNLNNHAMNLLRIFSDPEGLQLKINAPHNYCSCNNRETLEHLTKRVVLVFLTTRGNIRIDDVTRTVLGCHSDLSGYKAGIRSVNDIITIMKCVGIIKMVGEAGVKKNPTLFRLADNYVIFSSLLTSLTGEGDDNREVIFADQKHILSLLEKQHQFGDIQDDNVA